MDFDHCMIPPQTPRQRPAEGHQKPSPPFFDIRRAAKVLGHPDPFNELMEAIGATPALRARMAEALKKMAG